MSRNFRDAVANLLKASPGEWIHWRDIANIGGGAAWRTRLSECRTQLGMNVENKQERRPSGVIDSYYRWNHERLV